MINPLDLKPQIEAVQLDVWMAIQAELSKMYYQNYLERQDDERYDELPESDEMRAIKQRIYNLIDLKNALKWYGENLQRWHR